MTTSSQIQKRPIYRILKRRRRHPKRISRCSKVTHIYITVLIRSLLTIYAATQADHNPLSPAPEKETPQFQSTTPPPAPVTLPFNLLQTSQRDIRLFPSLTSPTTLSSSSPSPQTQVLCRQALHQRMPPGFNHLSHMERLNMIFQIPELGLVIIGNQVGRVGVLSLTRWEERRLEGYRIEAILPLREEEERGVRPRRALLGMAVAPVQGMEIGRGASPAFGGRTYRPSTGRRWRLVMIYYDHTVLSYEISRMEGEGEVLVV